MDRAPEWIRRLMMLADTNSNQKGGGGTRRFDDRKKSVLAVAPERWSNRIGLLPFKANTPGVHGAAADELISAALLAASPLAPRTQWKTPGTLR